MKKSLIILFVLLMSVSLMAQVRTGSIYGKVTDTEGTALPGVTVTLSSAILAPTTVITSDTGAFRFPGLSVASDYNLSAELTGFKKATKSGIIVAIGANVEINLTLEIGKLEEEVTVVAITPVVDAKKTAVATNLTRNEMQSLPTARDPWVVMQLAPGIMLDRENVGGNESGQQSSFLTKGDMSNSGYYGSNNIFAVDGIDITDPAAMGGSALYFDFDMFEELNITTGGADVTIQSGGIALNMVTRRGGNKANLAGRFYLTDNYFQATNLTQNLIDQGVRATNKIQQIKDYGVNAGGPIIKDKVWWWAAYGVQDIFVYTVYSTKDQSLLNNYNFKINAQLFANNRLEALITAGAKEKLGRNASVAKPEGDHQTGKYHWGSPVLKIQDEQVFGSNLYVSLRYTFNDAGFGWVPMVDETMSYPVTYDRTALTYVALRSSLGRSWDHYYASRPRNNYQATATYFNDSLLGLAHEIKVGFEYSNKQAQHRWGNGRQFQIDVNYPGPQIDLNGDGTKDKPTGWRRFNFYREGMDNSAVNQYAGYAQDTISAGNFTFLLGLRYDLQKPYSGAYTIPTVLKGNSAWNYAMDSTVQDALANLLPSIQVKALTPDYKWNNWSPRLGITWDITGDGKTIAKASVAQYGDIMGTGTGLNPPLGLGGSMMFWWLDGNGNTMLDLNELYWIYSATNPLKYQPYHVFSGTTFVGNYADGYKAGMWGGFDPNNPTFVDYTSLPTTTYASDARSGTRTQELLLTVEREILPDFAASINFSLRKYSNFDWWTSYYPETGQSINSASWYVVGGTVPATVGPYSTGDAAGRPWYRLDPNQYTVGTDYTLVQKSKQYNTYWGVDFVITKRLSNRWFMDASVTIQDERAYWNGSGFDPTNKWAFDGQPYALSGGGASGKTSINMYTRWMAKLSAMYQLPWDFNLSGTFNAREGWRIPHYFWIEDDSLSGLSLGNYVYTQLPNKDALPTFYNITLRLEKMVKIGDGRLYFMADVFNLLNSDIVNRAYDAYLGEYYVDTNTFVPNANNRKLNEILNPRITRFGVRFEF